MNIYAPVIPDGLCKIRVAENTFGRTTHNDFESWHSPSLDNKAVRNIIKRVQTIFCSSSNYKENLRVSFYFEMYPDGCLQDCQQSINSIGGSISLSAFHQIVGKKIGFEVKYDYIPQFNNVCITTAINELIQPSEKYADSGDFLENVTQVCNKFSIFYKQLYLNNSNSCFVFKSDEYDSELDLLHSYFKNGDIPAGITSKVKKVNNFNEVVLFTYSVGNNRNRNDDKVIIKSITDQIIKIDDSQYKSERALGTKWRLLKKAALFIIIGAAALLSYYIGSRYWKNPPTQPTSLAVNDNKTDSVNSSTGDIATTKESIKHDKEVGSETTVQKEKVPAARFIDNKNGTITDTKTGLIWLKNANTINQKMNWVEANSRVKSIRIAGRSWRIPSKNEFDSLIKDWSQTADTSYEYLKNFGFDNIQSWYWTSTEKNEEDAFFILMRDGTIQFSGKTGEYYIWPVSSR